MNRNPLTDGYKALAALALGFVGPWLVIAALGFAFGRCSKGYTSTDITALRDTVRLTDSVRVVVRDTLTVYKRRLDTVRVGSDSLDAQVAIQDDSTVLVQDTVYSVPPLVIADLRALRVTVATQDTLLRWWERKSAADSLAIQARDRLIAAQKPERCGRKCGAVLGTVATLGLLKLIR